MLGGEQCQVRVSPEYGYGDVGCGHRIPPGAILYFEITLLNCVRTHSDCVVSSTEECSRLPFSELYKFTASISILEQENTVRENLEHLKEMRRNREREKKKLKEKEAELYAKLGTHCLTMCSVYIQSEKDLQEMKLRVQALEQEKVIVC
ncbi:hypothetical protein MRX96_007751 [Rhipicephalus microplus]